LNYDVHVKVDKFRPCKKLKTCYFSLSLSIRVSLQWFDCSTKRTRSNASLSYTTHWERK